jgi:flavin reductase (DIM6/NTAB) family NADH-FMN oxidoreductase RutF
MGCAKDDVMEADFTTLPEADRYRLLTNFVGPRPIALVTTLNEDGSDNAAPMSFFNVFSHEPPLLVLGIQPRQDGRSKDTLANLRRTGSFTVNMVDLALAPAMAATAMAVEPGVDELALAGLTPKHGHSIPARSIGESPCIMECRVERCLDWPKRTLVIGEVLFMRVRADCLDAAGRYVNPDHYHPIARLHADSYIVADRQFELKVPPLRTATSG